MPSFLDITGLSKLLGNIKSIFATKTELAALDDSTSNQINELDQTLVHKTGDEVISGTKCFLVNSSTAPSGLQMIAGDSAVTRYGIPPTDKFLSTCYWSSEASTNQVTASNYARYLLGCTEYASRADGSRDIKFLCTKPDNTTIEYNSLMLGYDENGVSYAQAPSTSTTRTAGKDIVTRDFIPNDARIVHSSGNETIAGTKTFSSTISGSINGNAATATKIQRNIGNGTYVGAATTGNALVNSTSTTFDAIWNAPTKNYQVACSTWPGNGDSVYLAYSVTKANISSGTNSVAKQCLWNADTGVLSASGGFSGNVTGNVTGNCSGTAANVTGTVAIANGGTGATTRLKGLQALTNENVGTSAQYFLTITSSWGKGGYSSTANAKTVLGISGSDRRIKDDIEEIPNEVLDAWDKVVWKQFRMKKEVREKGENAPLHAGAIVQDMQKALADGGVESSRYGFLYHEDYLPEEKDLPSDENPEITNGEKWYLKYDEAFAIEAAWQRRLNERLLKRMEVLENELTALKRQINGE